MQPIEFTWMRISTSANDWCCIPLRPFRKQKKWIMSIIIKQVLVERFFFFNFFFLRFEWIAWNDEVARLFCIVSSHSVQIRKIIIESAFQAHFHRVNLCAFACEYRLIGFKNVVFKWTLMRTLVHQMVQPIYHVHLCSSFYLNHFFSALYLTLCARETPEGSKSHTLGNIFTIRQLNNDHLCDRNHQNCDKFLPKDMDIYLQIPFFLLEVGITASNAAL